MTAAAAAGAATAVLLLLAGWHGMWWHANRTARRRGAR